MAEVKDSLSVLHMWKRSTVHCSVVLLIPLAFAAVTDLLDAHGEPETAQSALVDKATMPAAGNAQFLVEIRPLDLGTLGTAQFGDTE